jgi:hypothetical protein
MNFYYNAKIGGKDMDFFDQPWKLVPNKIRGNGGREIDKHRGISPPIDTPDGSEAWIGSVTRVAFPPVGKPNWGCSEVVLPNGNRMFLFEAIAMAPEKILGKQHIAIHGCSLGVLIKFLDAKEQYMLQSHPTREGNGQKKCGKATSEKKKVGMSSVAGMILRSQPM